MRRRGLVLKPLPAHADPCRDGMQFTEVDFVSKHMAARGDLPMHHPAIVAQIVDVNRHGQPQCLAPEVAAGAVGAGIGAEVFAVDEADIVVPAAVVSVLVEVLDVVEVVAGVLSMALIIDFEAWSIA